MRNDGIRNAFILFILVILFHLLPLWMYGYFATQDGPSHLHNSAVMLDYFTAATPVLREYYEVRPTLAGNVISQVALIGLNAVTSARIADKIFLGAYVILLSLGFWYAVTSVRSDGAYLAFLIFPFVYSAWIHMGLYNFCIGMAIALFIVGYFIRRQKDFGLRQMAVLALLLLVAYSAHIMAFGAAVLIIGALTLTAIAARRNHEAERGIVWPGIRKPELLPMMAILPTVFLASLFLVQHRGEGAPTFALDSLKLAAWRIYSLAPIASVSHSDYLWGKAMAAVVGVLGIVAAYSKWKDGRLRLHDGLFLSALGFLTLSIIGPDTVVDGTYVRMRMVFYFYFALIIWIAMQSIPKTVAKCGAIAAVGVSVFLFASRAPLYSELDQQAREYFSAAPYIAPNTTLLALSYASHGYHPTEQRLVRSYLPFEHISGLLATERAAVDLSNYEAASYSFWTRYRTNMDPFRYVNSEGKADLRASAANLFGYPPEGSGRIDYVLFWGIDENGRRTKPPQRLRDQLIQAYELVYVSPGRQLVQLYRRKS